MKKPRQNKNRIILGITGSFGTGKSTVASIIKKLAKAKVIDADKLARRNIQKGTKIQDKIIKAFGRGILDGNGCIIRAKLAGIVFNDNSALRKLNRIIHPEVIKEIKSLIGKSSARIIVLDAPLLIEAGLDNMVDEVIVVASSLTKQLQRLKKKTSLSKEEILLRIKSQVPLRVKTRLADFVIDNNGSLNETRKQVKKVLRKMNYPA
ncbi:MAG: dephospho-CoA kinase [Candidatus Omnitrophica bacterium]|nr:dephospho-CoA kinase [Candidatus Omnitrophota bacterium]